MARSKRAPDLGWIAPDLRGLARPVGELVADPKNARRHGDPNLAAIEASLRAHGQRKPVVVREGVVLAGNGTLEAARRIGWTHLACVEYEGPEAMARAFAVADNRAGELATWDDAVLGEALRELEAAGLLAATGYDGAGLAEALEAADRAITAAAAPPSSTEDPGVTDPPVNPASVPGEVYELGPHRLLCGDSTDAGLVAALFGEDRCALVWTDPPYGVELEEKNEQLRRYGCGRSASVSNRIVSDGDEAGAWNVAERALLVAGEHAVPGAAIYCATPSGTAFPRAWAALETSGWGPRWTLAWVKDRLVLGRGDYHHRFEPILYGWREGAHFFVDDRTQTTVFEVPAPKASPEHPTMKPVELVERMVANSSRPGDVVYDPFGGSGTTLIACARLGRRCLTVELDPAYADVVRRRWTAWARQAGREPGSGALE